jgi:hypothetical protein
MPANLMASLTQRQALQLDRPLSDQQRGLFRQAIDLAIGEKSKD